MNIYIYMHTYIYIYIYIYCMHVCVRACVCVCVCVRIHTYTHTHTQSVSARSSRSAWSHGYLPPMSNSTASGTLAERILVREHILRIISQTLAANVQLNGLGMVVVSARTNKNHHHLKFYERAHTVY
jgi:hypothetical protein